jgi:hypothetical protein
LTTAVLSVAKTNPARTFGTSQTDKEETTTTTTTTTTTITTTTTMITTTTSTTITTMVVAIVAAGQMAVTHTGQLTNCFLFAHFLLQSIA